MNEHKVIYPVPFYIDAQPSHVVVRKLFSDELCRRLIDTATRNGFRRDTKTQYGEEGKISVEVSQISPSDAPEAYELLAAKAALVNCQNWRLALTGITAPFEVLRYSVGDWIRPHSDSDCRTPDPTKISCIVQIVAHSAFTGGQFSVAETDKPQLDIGDALFFPSHIVHSVSKVTNGTRIVLIGWIDGPPLA